MSTTVKNPVARGGRSAFSVCRWCGDKFTQQGISRHWDHCKNKPKTNQIAPDDKMIRSCNLTLSEDDYRTLEAADIENGGLIADVLSRNGHASWTGCPVCHVDDFTHSENCKFAVQLPLEDRPPVFPMMPVKGQVVFFAPVTAKLRDVEPRLYGTVSGRRGSKWRVKILHGTTNFTFDPSTGLATYYKTPMILTWIGNPSYIGMHYQDAFARGIKDMKNWKKANRGNA